MKTTSPIRLGLRNGLTMGIISIFMALSGMPIAFSKRALIGNMTLTVVIIALLGLLAGYFTIRKFIANTSQKILAAVVAGVLNGAMLALLVWLVNSVDMRSVLVNATPDLVNQLSLGRGATFGIIALPILFGLLAAITVLVGLIPDRLRQAILWGIGIMLLIGLFWEVLTGLTVSTLIIQTIGVSVGRVLMWPAAIVIMIVAGLFSYFQPDLKRTVDNRYRQMPAAGQTSLNWVGWVLVIALLLVLPQAVGQFWAQTLTTVGLFLLMGLGLNIVVGLAGLLDLGYVAFYAIGAYTMALLSSPAASAHTEWSFWIVLPISLLVAAMSGILLGIPVLRLRGDYLAIVTLGFGEIIRILAMSDLLKPYIGGPQGILETPPPQVIDTTLKDPRLLYYLILAACFLGMFVSTRLNFSRIGRAWIAMREDEDVAQAMGINLVASKLMAFSIGAALAGVGGAIFASRQGAIFPSDFTLFISINVLCLIIIGGIGSLPGTIVGALFLVGLPEVLREIDEFRILAYGAGLVIMMIVKPEGLLPSARRRLELHEQEPELVGEAAPVEA